MYRYCRVTFCSPDAPLRRAPDARDVLQPDHRVAAPFGSDKAHRELSRRGGVGPRGGWVRFHPRRCALHVVRLDGRVARARRGASPAHHRGVRHLGKPPAVLRRGLGEQAGNAVRLENRRVGVGAAVAAEHARGERAGAGARGGRRESPRDAPEALLVVGPGVHRVDQERVLRVESRRLRVPRGAQTPRRASGASPRPRPRSSPRVFIVSTPLSVRF